MIKLIDISNWQGNVDFLKVKTVMDGVIMKAVEGVGFIDPKFKDNQTKTRAAGLLVGYYAFVRPDLGNTPEAEADYFLSICKPTVGEVLCLDFEVSFADKVNWCKKWLDRVYAKTGCRPLIYLNKSTISGSNWSSVISSNYGLWMADYSYNPDSEVPENPWPIVAMRQYSNNEVVPGISGGVDANVFYGDKTMFKKYGLPLQAEPTIPVTPTPPVISDLDKCRESQKVLLGQLEIEIAGRKALEATVADQAQKITTLQAKLQEAKPIESYTFSELLGALVKAVGK